MILAYDEVYLSVAQNNMSSMFDFVVHDLNLPLEGFYRKFLDSDVSLRFGTGDPSVVAGRSGMELAAMILGDEAVLKCYRPVANRSPVYWTGWALAYFQWYSGLSFREIERSVPIGEIREMYDPFHEMDIRHFSDHMVSLIKARNPVPNLKRMRTFLGLTQRELAARSEIPLRTIQQYEQRQKNINAASALVVLRLSRVLFCRPEELLEL